MLAMTLKRNQTHEYCFICCIFQKYIIYGLHSSSFSSVVFTNQETNNICLKFTQFWFLIFLYCWYVHVKRDLQHLQWEVLNSLFIITIKYKKNQYSKPTKLCRSTIYPQARNKPLDNKTFPNHLKPKICLWWYNCIVFHVPNNGLTCNEF